MLRTDIKISTLQYMPALTGLTYVALAGLYVPTFYKLFTYGWKNADYSHGPLILLAFFWLVWKQRRFLQVPSDASFRVVPLGLQFSGIVLYIVGSVFSSMVLESISLIPLFLGTAWFLQGPQATRLVLFPGLFLFFLIPPPAFVIDTITAPLQVLVTWASATALKGMGYFITRDGVILHIDDYTIIVGEVCSGLRSLISLMAVGALYAWLQEASRFRKTMLFVTIIPIAVLANIIRLIVLALITHRYGEAAGQGFFHDFSGFVLFFVAIVSLVIIDALSDQKREKPKP